jgi:hypothetical protein
MTSLRPRTPERRPSSPEKLVPPSASSSQGSLDIIRDGSSSAQLKSKELIEPSSDAQRKQAQRKQEELAESSQQDPSDRQLRRPFPSSSSELTVSRHFPSEGLRTPPAVLLVNSESSVSRRLPSEGLRRVRPESSKQDIPLRNLTSSSMPVLPLYHHRSSEDRSRPSETRDVSQNTEQAELSNEALRIYTERIIKDLRIPAARHDEARPRIETMYRIIEKGKKATTEEEHDEACKSILELAPNMTIIRWTREGEIGKVSGALFHGGKKTRLETNNIRMSGELGLAKDSAGKNYFARNFDKVTHALTWRLNEPGYRAVLATSLGTVSTLTPLAYGEGFVPVAIPINVIATYADTAIFKNFSYPWNLALTTGLWQGSSFLTAFAQKGIEKLSGQ